MQTNDVATQIPIPPLRAVRQARGLGLREVARQASLDPSYLSRVERGKQGVSLGALLRIARALELRELVRFLEPYVREAGGG